METPSTRPHSSASEYSSTSSESEAEDSVISPPKQTLTSSNDDVRKQSGDSKIASRSHVSQSTASHQLVHQEATHDSTVPQTTAEKQESEKHKADDGIASSHSHAAKPLEQTSASPVTETKSRTRSDWTSIKTGSFTTSFSDEETESTLGPGVGLCAFFAVLPHVLKRSFVPK